MKSFGIRWGKQGETYEVDNASLRRLHLIFWKVFLPLLNAINFGYYNKNVHQFFAFYWTVPLSQFMIFFLQIFFAMFLMRIFFMKFQNSKNKNSDNLGHFLLLGIAEELNYKNRWEHKGWKAVKSTFFCWKRQLTTDASLAVVISLLLEGRRKTYNLQLFLFLRNSVSLSLPRSPT